MNKNIECYERNNNVMITVEFWIDIIMVETKLSFQFYLTNRTCYFASLDKMK